MTALAAPVRHQPATRIVSVARLYLVNRWLYLGIPWVIMATATAISLVITLLIRSAAGEDADAAVEGMRYSWAVLSPFWYMVAAGTMAISATFPFAMALTITRREFYLGTSLMFCVLAAINAIGFTILTELERATGGWGIGMRMFTSLWLGHEPWYVNLLSFFAIQVFTLFIGASVAAVWMRWRINGMLVFWVSVAVVIVGAAAVIVLTGAGPAMVDWAIGLGVAGAFGLVLLVAALAALAGFLVLRRASLKNS